MSLYIYNIELIPWGEISDRRTKIMLESRNTAFSLVDVGVRVQKK